MGNFVPQTKKRRREKRGDVGSGEVPSPNALIVVVVFSDPHAMLSAARRFLGGQLAAGSNALAAPWMGPTRGIITVKVNDPVLRGAVDKESLESEIIRAEEMAIAQFNRQVRKEVELGSVHQSGRRMKRLSRFTYPAQARRAAGAAWPNASTVKASTFRCRLT